MKFSMGFHTGKSMGLNSVFFWIEWENPWDDNPIGYNVFKRGQLGNQRNGGKLSRENHGNGDCPLPCLIAGG